MKKNMGTADKSIRIALAIVVAILYFTNVISGTVAIILGAISLIFILTSLISFCPLYTVCGLQTKQTKEEEV